MKWLATGWAMVRLVSWAAGELVVYDAIPGAEASGHYRVAVRELGGEWREAFVLVTRCKQGQQGKNKYFAHLSGWTNSYVNFEMTKPVEVEIARVNGKPIGKAAAHPRRHVRSCEVRNGKAYLVIDEPALVAVDVDGQMDDQDTGFGYEGPPIHTVTIFANPLLADRPAMDGPGVYAVKPGEPAPDHGPWRTLYFLPGVHDVGVGFRVRAGRQYYLPGDALVYGTLTNNGRWRDGHDIRIFGYGTLSGARISHPDFAEPARAQMHDPIHIVGAANTSVTGITVADSAFHSVMLINKYDEARPTTVRWVKVFTWRANGDGINPFANGLVEDCFVRTQDDSLYVNGRGIRRVTIWNDYNGSAFVLSALPNRPLVVEDCEVIYARAGWPRWSGGRVFNMRGEGGGACGAGVIFRNIRVTDKRPTLQHFMIAMEGVEPYSDPAERRRGPGDLAGVLFQDVEIAAPSVLGEPEVLWGSSEARIRNLTFDNVRIGGKPLKSLDDFRHNEFVKQLEFVHD